MHLREKVMRTTFGTAALVVVSPLLISTAMAQEINCESGFPLYGYEICSVEFTAPNAQGLGLSVAATSPDGRVVIGQAGYNAFRAVIGEDDFQVLSITYDHPVTLARNYALGVSDDGLTIVGGSHVSGETARAVKWVSKIIDGQEQYVSEYLNPTTSDFNSTAYAANSDGRYIVGANSVSEFSRTQPTLWFFADDVTRLITLPVRESESFRSHWAVDVNSDGSVITGNSGIGDSAVRWVASGPTFDGLQNYQLQNLGHLNYLEQASVRTFSTAINSGGNVIVGASGGQAFRWLEGGTEGDNTNPQMQGLGYLDGYRHTTANDVNHDGTVVIGQAHWLSDAGSNDDGAFAERAFRWVEGGVDGSLSNLQMQDLGTLSGHTDSRADAVSADGATVLGTSYKSGAPAESGRLYIWRATDSGGVMEDRVNLINSFSILGNHSAVAQSEQQFTLGQMMKQNSFAELGRSTISVNFENQHIGRADTNFTERTSSLATLSFGYGVSDSVTLGGTLKLSDTPLENNAFDMDTGLGTAIWGQYSEGSTKRTGLQFGGAVGYLRSEGEIARGLLLSDVFVATGVAEIDTRAVQATLGYGVQHNGWLLTPSLGIAHYDTRREAYEEVDAPFNANYDEMRTSRTVATLDVSGEFQVNKKVSLSLGVRLDRDLRSESPQLSGTSGIPGLTAFNFDNSLKLNRTRASVRMGYTYDFGNGSTITSNVRVGKTLYGTARKVSLGLNYSMQF